MLAKTFALLALQVAALWVGARSVSWRRESLRERLPHPATDIQEEMRDEMEKEWMEKLSNKAEVMRLIQDVLGCGCPKEVFEHIQMELMRTNDISILQLILGNKLMVWIVDSMKIDRLKDISSRLLDRGRIERDSRQLNRFRLVLVGEVLKPEAEELQKLPGTKHDKVHLHILPQLFE